VTDRQEEPIVKLYSEVGTARAREIAADVATIVWVGFWIIIGIRINDAMSDYAGLGRTLRGGGTSIQGAGAQLGDVLGNVPVVGGGIDAITTGAFGTAGAPFVEAGDQLESLLLLIARLLAVLVVGVFVVPWLFKYVPWRAGRLSNLRAAHLALRGRPTGVSETAMQQALATRAINRLSYQELLDHAADPFGDFAAGRYERLAKAELESVGLR
jgi:hypothetical protein